MTNHTKKRGENSKIRYFAHFCKKLGFFHFIPPFDGIFGNILRFSRLILQWETKVTLGILCSNPILSNLFRDKTLEIYSGLIRQKH